MSATSLADRRLDLVVRQLGNLLDRGLSVEQALEQLTIAAPARVQPLAQRLAEVINRANAGIARDPGPFGVLNHAMVLASGAGGEPARTLPAMLRLSADLRDTARRTREAFYQRLAYTGVLTLLALLMSLMFVAYVWPAHAGFYGNFGATLPARFAFVQRLGVLGHPLVFGLLGVAVAGLGILVHLGTRRLADARPMAWPLTSIPGFRRLAASAQIRITLALCDALVNAGADDEWVLEEVGRLDSRGAASETALALRFAQKAGNLAEEVRHQVHDNQRRLKSLAKRAGSISIVLLKALLFAAIAHLIVSYYIPIFQLGSVITR